MNTLSIMTDMETVGWRFRPFIDEKQKHRYVGRYGDYGVLVDVNNDKLEFWHENHEWWLNYKPDDAFSQSELELDAVTCDFCGLVQADMTDLTLVNVIQKACTSCVKENSCGC